MIRAGAPALYISMSDAYNEGIRFVKTAESAAFVPAGGKFLPLDEDGTRCFGGLPARTTRAPVR